MAVQRRHLLRAAPIFVQRRTIGQTTSVPDSLIPMNARDAISGGNDAFKSERAAMGQSSVTTSTFGTDENNARLLPASSADSRSAYTRDVQIDTIDDVAANSNRQIEENDKFGNSSFAGSSAHSIIGPLTDLPGGAHVVLGRISPPTPSSVSCSVDIANKATFLAHDDSRGFSAPSQKTRRVESTGSHSNVSFQKLGNATQKAANVDLDVEGYDVNRALQQHQISISAVKASDCPGSEVHRNHAGSVGQVPLQSPKCLISCLNMNEVSFSAPENEKDLTVILEADSSNKTMQDSVPPIFSPSQQSAQLHTVSPPVQIAAGPPQIQVQTAFPVQHSQSKGTSHKEETVGYSLLVQLNQTGEGQHNTLQSVPKVHDETKNRRAPLVDAFTPFIQPSDTSLKAARERLVTALDQTRMLREAFSVRVYNKYRVVLRPVQSSVSEMITEIIADPETANVALSKHTKMIKDEKELEKKEAQKINAEVAASAKGEGKEGFVNAENAEQLSWFGAGLSLVVLPEEDVDDAELAARGIKHRGPTDLSNGNRVGGISSAAAAAAEQILDRVRKGSLLRMERSRKNFTASVTDSFSNEEMRLIPMTSLNVVSNACGVPWCDSRYQSPITALTQPLRSLPRTGFPKGHYPLSDVSGRASKVRLPSSGINPLSLSPNGEGLGPNGNPTAATTALITCGVGSNITSSKISEKLPSSQQRLRHPHPQSKSGRKCALLPGGGGPSAKKGSGLTPAIASASITGDWLSTCLPSLPTNSERQTMRPVPILQDDQIISNEAYKGVKAVINAFLVPLSLDTGIESPVELHTQNDIDCATSQNNGNVDAQNVEDADARDGLTASAKPLYRKRRITEIGLLKEIRFFRRKTETPVMESGMQDGVMTHNKGNLSTDEAFSIYNDELSAFGSLDQSVDPHLAFSVLHALGVISDSKYSSTSDTVNYETDHLNHEGVSVLSKCGSRFQFKSAATETAADDGCFKADIDFLARNPVCVQSLSFFEKIADSVYECSTEKKREPVLTQNLAPKDILARKNNETLDVCERNVTDAVSFEATYVPNLRGGGESKINEHDDILPINSKQEVGMASVADTQDDAMRSSRRSAASFSQKPAGPIHIDDRLSPIGRAYHQNSNPLHTSIGSHRASGSSLMTSTTTRVASMAHQQHLSTLQNNDLMPSSNLWGEQVRAGTCDSGIHHAQLASSHLQHRMSSPILEAPHAMMPQSRARSSSLGCSLSPSSSPLSNGLAIPVSATARVQGQQHQQFISRPLSGGHDRYHRHTPSSLGGHNSSLSQSSIQHVVSLHPSSSPSNHLGSDLVDYFGDSLQQTQRMGSLYNIPSSEWTSLGSTAGFLPSQSSLAASMGLTSHQAAMVSLQARAILAREQQQQAAAAHAHANAVAAHRNAAPVSRENFVFGSVTAQQASQSVGGEASADDYSYSRSPLAARFAHLGANSAAALLSNSAFLSRQQIPTSALSSESQIGQTQATITSCNPKWSTQEARPSSASSWPSPPSHSSSMRPSSAESRSTSTGRLKVVSTTSKNRTLSANNSSAESQIDLPPVPKTIATQQLENHSRQIIAPPKPTKNATWSSSTKLNKTVLSSLSIDTKDKRNNMSMPQIHPTDLKLPAADAGSLLSQVDKSVAPFRESDFPNMAVVASQPQNGTFSNLSGSSVIKDPLMSSTTSPDAESNANFSISAGMSFFAPPIPKGLSANQATLIAQSLFHHAAAGDRPTDLAVEEKPVNDSKHDTALIEYLMALSTAVPISKALVANPLKERLSSPAFKSIMSKLVSVSGSLVTPREVIGAAITTWLWAHHKDSFEKAFAKSGRTDVDPDCKWLVNSAIDTSTRALLAEANNKIFFVQTPGVRSPKGGEGPGKLEVDGSGSTQHSNTIAVKIASLISETLMKEMCIDSEVDATIPNLNNMVKHLDELRVCALRAKSQERALLAALTSRRVRMSESFSQAYTSSMVRAGEALGYEDLCDIVQDEATMSSTLLPFDILNDASGAWEDPCRPLGGFIPGLDGDDLTKRAHARAQIQKSLKKLQDKYDIRGGTPTAGPYAEVAPTNSLSISTDLLVEQSGSSLPVRTFSTLSRTVSGLKRKSSFTGLVDSTGGAPSAASATMLNLFNPTHYSTPFVWDNNQIESMPYGRHAQSEDKASSSYNERWVLSGVNGRTRDRRKMQRMSADLLSVTEKNCKATPRSTQEIEWSDVAGMFQSVNLGAASERSSSVSNSGILSDASQMTLAGSNIFAPYCRALDEISSEPESESYSSDEDTSDETVLARHQEVLDGMKGELDAMMEIRQQYQERSRNRSSGGR